MNEVGIQSLTRSGRVYNPDSSVQFKGKEVATDGTRKKTTDKGEEQPKEKKKEEEMGKCKRRLLKWARAAKTEHLAV